MGSPPEVCAQSLVNARQSRLFSEPLVVGKRYKGPADRAIAMGWGSRDDEKPENHAAAPRQI
jgi:hypothetical protein